MTAPRWAAITIDMEFPTSWKDRSAGEQALHLLDLSIELGFPLTWMIKFSAQETRAVAEHFFSSVRPSVPDTHEIGLHVHFDDEERQNYIRDPLARRELIETGHEILREYHVRPRTFRAGCCRVESCDLLALSKIGIAVESSIIPGVAGTKDLADGRKCNETQPYYPDPADICREGNSPVLEVPILPDRRTPMFLDRWQDTWQALEILRKAISRGDRFLCIVGHDGSANLDSVRK
jgi:hypothetical protein